MSARRDIYAFPGGSTWGPFTIEGSRFPTFSDGDVKIIISGARQYQLHKSVLKNISPLFHDLLAEEHTATLSKKAQKKGAVVTNMLRAVENNSDDGRPDVILEPVKLDDGGRAISKITIGLGLENAMAPLPVYTAWEKVLGAFYHQPINLNDFGHTQLKDILPSAGEVLRVAQYLGCVPIITQHFEATLLAMGQKLYRAIAKAPGLWLELSLRMRSKPLYHESMIHAAGQYRTPELQSALPSFPDDTQQMLSHLCAGIVAEVKDLASKMMTYYPQELQRLPSTGLVDKENTSRASYGNDILSWMALTIFRHWLGHQISDDRTHHAIDLGFGFIRMLGSGTYFKPGQAYLPEPDTEAWHAYFPMTTKAKHAVQLKLEDTKRQFWHAPGLVPLNMIWHQHLNLLVNHSKLEVDRYPADFFTCASVYIDSFPWEAEIKQEDTEEEETENDAEYEEDSNGSSRMDMDEVGAEAEPVEYPKFDKKVKPTVAAARVIKGALIKREREEYSDYDDDEFEDELNKMDPRFESSRRAAGL